MRFIKQHKFIAVMTITLAFLGVAGMVIQRFALVPGRTLATSQETKYAQVEQSCKSPWLQRKVAEAAKCNPDFVYNGVTRAEWEQWLKREQAWKDRVCPGFFSGSTSVDAAYKAWFDEFRNGGWPEDEGITCVCRDLSCDSFHYFYCWTQFDDAGNLLSCSEKVCTDRGYTCSAWVTGIPATPVPEVSEPPLEEPSPTPTPEPTPTPVLHPSLQADGSNKSTRPQFQTFVFFGELFQPGTITTRHLKDPAGKEVQLSPDLTADIQGILSWSFTPDCSATPGGWTVWTTDQGTGLKSESATLTVTANAYCSLAKGTARPSDFGLREGDLVGARSSGDPDIFIINDYGYKRLFLNPVIFGFYGHLGGYGNVKEVAPSARDVFVTSNLYRNCETASSAVYALEVTGGDTGTLHEVNPEVVTAIATRDPSFYNRVFCINNNEFNWYPKGGPYSDFSQVSR